MTKPIIYGADYSTYVRSVRLCLEEKGITYQIQPVDILNGESKSPEHLARHPFGKIPAFEHDGFSLFETSAIVRYIDDVFGGTPLQPSDPHQRARMNQVLALVDSYGYGALVGTIFVQRAIVPKMGGNPDEEAIAKAVPIARKVIEELDHIVGNHIFLAGDIFCLADIYLIPVYDYALLTPEGSDILLHGAAGLQRWWSGVNTRRSVVTTRPHIS